MTNYWSGDWKENGTYRERVYTQIDTLPLGVKMGRYDDTYFYAVEPYLAHAKVYGTKVDKKFDVVVYGVNREKLLVKFKDPASVEMSHYFKAEGWHTVRFDETTEGWRFVRSVVKLMKVLVSVAKKAAVERRKVERNRAAAKARAGREATCQICEGQQIVQPTGENKGTLVLHGYNRPGYGYTVGNCYGYHRKPFEVTCDALVEFVDALKAKKANAEALLAALPTWTKMLVEENWRTKKLVEITKEDARWNSAMSAKVWETESEIRSLTTAITYHEKRLAGWKPVAEFVEKWGA